MDSRTALGIVRYLSLVGLWVLPVGLASAQQPEPLPTLEPNSTHVHSSRRAAVVDASRKPIVMTAKAMSNWLRRWIERTLNAAAMPPTSAKYTASAPL